MPGIARGGRDAAAGRAADSWRAGATQGAHTFPTSPRSPSCSQNAALPLPARGQAEPHQPSTGQRLRLVPASLQRVPAPLRPCTAAGDRHRATAQAAAPPAHAARPPMPSGNSLFAPQTVSLGPAGFPINFYRKYKMTSGSLWQIGFHSSYKQGRALLSLNFSQMLLSMERKK